MTSNMKFSVLLSLYSKEKPEYLDLALRSVFSQTHRADEVILVEDGPLTPDLYAMVEKYKTEYSDLIVLPLEKNVGLGRALNEGLKHCTYEIVARMDTDDISKPERFEKEIAYLDTHSECDIVGSWIDEFQGDIRNIKTIRKVPETHEEIFQYCKGRCPVNHPTVMFRKRAVLEAGGYYTKYFPEDYFLWIKMLMNGARFYNIPESLLFFRTSSDTIKKRGGWKYAIGEIHIQKHIYDLGFISFPLFLKNSTIRFIVRILPLKIRSFVYNIMLREKKST